LNKFREKEAKDKIEREEREKKFTEEQRERLKNIFNEYYKQRNSYAQQPQQQSPSPDFKTILLEFKITTKKEWKIWLLHNHPDKMKNNDKNAIFCKIMDAGRQMGW